MMKPCDVSVIVPTYHREAQVVEAVGSVLRQEGVTVEVIVMDDSPTGSAEKVISAMADPRVRYAKMATPSRGKPALVRNEGLKLALGRYVHFLDDDDMLEPGALAALSGALDANPHHGMAFGVVVPFGENDEVLRQQQAFFRGAVQRARAARSRMHLTAKLLFGLPCFVNSACLCRREAALSCGGYNSAVQICEDIDFYMRIARAHDFLFVDVPVLRYRTGASSLMHDLEDDDPKVHESYGVIYDRYIREHGRGEFYALKVLAHLT